MTDKLHSREVVITQPIPSLMALYGIVRKAFAVKALPFPYEYSEFCWQLNLTDAEYADAAAAAVVGKRPYHPRQPAEGKMILIMDMEEISLHIPLRPDEATSDRMLFIDDVFVEDFLSCNTTERHLSDVHPYVLQKMLDAYEDVGENWVAEEGYPTWFNFLAPPNSPSLYAVLSEFNTLTSGPVGDLIKICGFRNYAAVSSTLHIPYKTLQQWCLGKANCKLYQRLYIAYGLGYIQPGICLKDDLSSLCGKKRR